MGVVGDAGRVRDVGGGGEERRKEEGKGKVWRGERSWERRVGGGAGTGSESEGRGTGVRLGEIGSRRVEEEDEAGAEAASSVSEVSSSSRAASSSSSSVSFSASRFPVEMTASTSRFDGLDVSLSTKGGASFPTPPLKPEGDAEGGTMTFDLSFPLSFFEPNQPFNTPNPYPFLSFFVLTSTSSSYASTDADDMARSS